MSNLWQAASQLMTSKEKASSQFKLFNISADQSSISPHQNKERTNQLQAKMQWAKAMYSIPFQLSILWTISIIYYDTLGFYRVIGVELT